MRSVRDESRHIGHPGLPGDASRGANRLPRADARAQDAAAGTDRGADQEGPARVAAADRGRAEEKCGTRRGRNLQDQEGRDRLQLPTR